VGVKERIRSQTTEISGVRVIDDFTLQIQTIRPTAYFIAMMSYPTSFVLDRANVEQLGRNWTSKPNGTGPFKLREYRIGERLVLERNPNYYRSPAKLDRVEYILSGGAAMAMYENNETEITGVGLADLDRVRDPKDPLNKDLHMAPPGFDISYIGFNTSRPPFDDPNVRRALNLATNKKLIADQVLANLVIPAYGILPPGFPGYTGKVTGLDFDAEKARATLVASRYANQQVKGAYAKYLQAKDTAALDAFKAAVKSAMPRTVVTVPGTGGGLGLDLEVITEMWRQTLGFEVEFQQVEWATFLQDLNGKKLQMFSGLGWQADYPDPQNFLDVLFHSESEINHGAYSNRQLDGILEQARTEPDWNRRVELYRQAEQLVLEDAPWVPLWFSSEAPYLLKPYVKGFVEAPLIVPKMAYVSIEKS
jgi:oligopeptide transport system substrate-binding protein